MRTIFLNTSIVTSPGTYTYALATLAEVQGVLQTTEDMGLPLLSAVGHQSTADVMTALLGIKVAMNRIEYRAEKGDVAIVFKLRGRPPEGKILSRDEIEAIGYDFGLLTRQF